MTGSVVLLTPTAAPGGAERALLGVARHLPGLGFDPRVVLLQEGGFEDWLAEAGIPTTVLPAGRLRDVRRFFGVVRELRRCIGRWSASAIISNQSKGHVYGGAAGIASRLPAVWWQHGVPTRSRIELAAAAIPSAAVICGSERTVAAQRALTRRRRIVKIPPGIPVTDVSSRRGTGLAIRKKLGWEAHPIVGIVGRLQPWKGQAVFLESVAAVAERHDEARFLVVGGAVLGWEGDYPAKLRALAERLGLGDKVRFTGHQTDVYPWMDALDVLVHASFGEPFGLVLVEAMALGKPLVATADGGPTEIIEDRVSGLLVPPGDHDRMADAISAVLASKDFANRLAAGALARASMFSEERCASAIADVLTDITELHRRRKPVEGRGAVAG